MQRERTNIRENAAFLPVILLSYALTLIAYMAWQCMLSGQCKAVLPRNASAP